MVTTSGDNGVWGCPQTRESEGSSRICTEVMDVEQGEVWVALHGSE